MAVLFTFVYSMDIRSTKHLLLVLFVTSYYVFIAWESTRLIVVWARKKYPSAQSSTSRLRFMGLMIVVGSLIVGFVNFWVTWWVGFYENFSYWSLPFLMGMNIFYSAIIAAVYEALYYFEQWKIAFRESEQLKKLNILSQFNSLKSQVNPHFLFNSLNSLSSLIQTNPDRAELFVEEMSVVYRYLLKNNYQGLTTLEHEITFLHSYIHMLKTRFGDGLQITLNINEDYHGYFLPPLALQMLLENAVKHNIVSKNTPLKVDIYTDDHAVLHVTNNLQKRHKIAHSEKTGLSNIIAHYKLTGQEGLYIAEEEHAFVIRLPLIKTNYNYADINSGR
ncbi:sensor histidine kinase [Chitinophaga skermanii]|nr:histidine kinase [Chitinophaga skermanii]